LIPHWLTGFIILTTPPLFLLGTTDLTVHIPFLAICVHVLILLAFLISATVDMLLAGDRLGGGGGKGSCRDAGRDLGRSIAGRLRRGLAGGISGHGTLVCL